MKKILLCCICISQLIISNSFAHDDNLELVREFLQDITRDNKHHMETLDRKTYRNFADKQTPRATVVMCSDSRIQNDDFKMHDVNDLFVIRNIGNQIRNAAGSVEYGIHFLKTPVLLIVGHSGCGAIKARVDKIDINNSNIEKELESLHLHKIDSLNEGILVNIHNQVDYAIHQFKELIKENKLVVIGAIDDFQNTYRKGVGRFIIINLNGEKIPGEIAKSPYFKDVKDLITLDQE